MKSLFKKILILAIVGMLCVTCFVSCSSTGKKLMELEDEEISVNMIMFMMSRMKGSIVASVGTKAESNSYWDTVMNASTGQTYDAYYTEQVIESAKTYIAALHMFDELGLELSKETKDEIDAEMDRLVETVGEGSKSYFNSILADYGANYNILKEAYILEAKIAALNDHLFGVNGVKISAELYEEYYQANYARFRHIFFYTATPRYETDEQGDEIYYSDLTEKKIAYDTEREGAVPKQENGQNVKDSHGQTVYVYEKDGKTHVSYDTKGAADSPTYRNPVLDEDGNVVQKQMSADELKELNALVRDITDNKVKAGEYKLFDSLVEQYNKDEGMEKYPNGYYLTATSQYDSPEVVKALFEMQVGEIRRVESDYGIHIVMKYELPEGGYADADNSDFFRNKDGTYSFMASLKSNLLSEYLQQYKAGITIDEERRKSLSMKNVAPNYNY